LFRRLFALGVAVLIGGPARADAEPAIAIIAGDENTVIACWEGTHAIQPMDCVGREAVAVTSPSTGMLGNVVRKSVAEILAVPRADGGAGPAFTGLFMPPIPVSNDEKSELHWLEDTDSLAVFVPTREQALVLPFRPPVTTPPFDTAQAKSALTTALRPTYFKIEPSEPIWLDVDGDDLPEAIAIGRSPDYPWCADLVVVHFDGNGQIRDEAALADHLAANKCRYPNFLTMRDDCEGESVPWPSSPGAYALALDCLTSGGDGWQRIILPLATLETDIRIAADYSSVWYSRPAQ